MKRSHAAWLAALVFFALGVAIAIPWAIVCLVSDGTLVANGAWLLMVICFAALLASVIEAGRAERAEAREELEALAAGSVDA